MALTILNNIQAGYLQFIWLQTSDDRRWHVVQTGNLCAPLLTLGRRSPRVEFNNRSFKSITSGVTRIIKYYLRENEKRHRARNAKTWLSPNDDGQRKRKYTWDTKRSKGGTTKELNCVRHKRRPRWLAVEAAGETIGAE